VHLEANGAGGIFNRMSVEASIRVGSDPTAAAISPNGLLAYVVNADDGTVSVIDTSTNEVTDTVSVGQIPVFVAFTPDSAFAYVVNQFDNSITVINTADNSTTLVTDPDSDLQEPTAMAITPDDWMVQAYREPGVQLLRGWPIDKLLQFWGGYEEGCQVPDGVNDTPIAVPIASQCLHAVGIAWAMKLKGQKNCVLCYSGDGGTSEGDFHEACNFACVYQAPVIFLVQNNQWAISVPRDVQTRSETLAQKAIAYGFDGVQVDGNDALAVYVATKEAVDKAKSGGGPTLIEAVTYRLGAHTTADDPTKYRKEDDVKKWEKRDPLIRMEKYMREKNLLDDKGLAEMEADIVEQIKAGIDRYEAHRDADPLDAIRFVYHELPAELVEQREEFARCLEQEGAK